MQIYEMRVIDFFFFFLLVRKNYSFFLKEKMELKW